MPFRLKNVRVNYQRMINEVFIRWIGRNLEVYVDNMLIKFKDAIKHWKDLDETFTTLRHNQMRLNLAKCACRVWVGKFLGFILTKQGIKANLERC